MRIEQHRKFEQLLRIEKHQLTAAIKKYIDYRIKTEQVTRTKMAYSNFYKKFRKFLYGYDKREVLLSSNGIGKDYVNYLLGLDLSNTTIKHQIDLLIVVLNQLDLHHDVRVKVLFKGMARSSRENEDYFLTNEEVKQLVNYKPRDKVEQVMLDRFLVACFTGCRISEIQTVKILDQNRLKYTSTKTKKDIIVPYNKMVRPYIESGLFLTKLKIEHEFKANKFLHQILKRLKWNNQVTKYRAAGKKKTRYNVPRWQAITFHSARKFYGKMLLDLDVPLYKVSKLLGHTSIAVTQDTYAAITREKMVDEVNELIDKF